jgi:rhodanese-related sulfurtransferase
MPIKKSGWSVVVWTTAMATLAVGLSGGDKMKYPVAKVSFEDFKSLVQAVEPHRAKRLVDLDTFLQMSRKPGAVVFDSRSDFRFERIHLKGAKHLAFSDFTQGNLAKVFPDFGTTILIYCNNNFEGNEVDFATKAAFPAAPVESAGKTPSPAQQIRAQEKPVTLALNIPTYINLYGYGYRNVYELNELVDVKDPRIEFEGSLAKKK